MLEVSIIVFPSLPPFPLLHLIVPSPLLHSILIYYAGTIFEVAKSTLMKEKDSMLTLMFSGRYPLTQGDNRYPIYPGIFFLYLHTSELIYNSCSLWFLYLGGDGAYFIDRDPTHFRLILN